MNILNNYNFINKSNRVPTIKLINLNNWPIKSSVSLLLGHTFQNGFQCEVVQKLRSDILSVYKFIICIKKYCIHLNISLYDDYMICKFITMIKLRNVFLWTCRPADLVSRHVDILHFYNIYRHADLPTCIYTFDNQFTPF